MWLDEPSYAENIFVTVCSSHYSKSIFLPSIPENASTVLLDVFHHLKGANSDHFVIGLGEKEIVRCGNA